MNTKITNLLCKQDTTQNSKEYYLRLKVLSSWKALEFLKRQYWNKLLKISASLYYISYICWIKTSSACWLLSSWLLTSKNSYKAAKIISCRPSHKKRSRDYGVDKKRVKVFRLFYKINRFSCLTSKFYCLNISWKVSKIGFYLFRGCLYEASYPNWSGWLT